MAAELQRIVDAVAAKLNCSAALDDTYFRIQVYSPHYGPVDETRLASILHRKVEGPVVDWILSHGIAEAHGATRVPGSAEIGLLPRICAPVRCRDVHLGYLWLVDADEQVRDADLDVVSEAADAAGFVMQREQLLEDLERAQERELLRDLVSADTSVREYAARELIDANLFVPAHRVVVFALRPVSPDRAPDEALQAAVAMALVHVRHSLMGHNGLHIGRHDRGVLLAAIRPARDEQTWLDDVGQRLRAAFVEYLPVGAGQWRPLVGIGGSVPSLAEAVTSQRQAYQATRVAEVLRTGDVLAWDDLGIYRTLIQLPKEELTESALHPGLVKLRSSEGGLPLLETLECFLDLAGDVKATAAKLMIHRATLYYRLGRIEKLADTDLSNGGDRLLLHLGLKMVRLAGLYPKDKPEQSRNPGRPRLSRRIADRPSGRQPRGASPPRPGRLHVSPVSSDIAMGGTERPPECGCRSFHRIEGVVHEAQKIKEAVDLTWIGVCFYRHSRRSEPFCILGAFLAQNVVLSADDDGRRDAVERFRPQWRGVGLRAPRPIGNILLPEVTHRVL
jgi:sugar diacid utilization regulator